MAPLPPSAQLQPSARPVPRDTHGADCRPARTAGLVTRMRWSPARGQDAGGDLLDAFIAPSDASYIAQCA